MKENLRPSLKAVLCLLFAFIFLKQQIIAQNIGNYSFAASAGTFTALAAPTNPSITTGNTDEGYFNAIPIGFDFWYMGTRITTLSASTNGWITMGASATAATSLNNLSAGGSPRPLIAPLWDDLDLQLTTNLSYLTTGAAGARIFTLQYLNVKWNSPATAAVISFQVKLYEATGRIDFIYRPEAGTVASPASASIGLAGTTTGAGNFMSISSTANVATASTVAETNNIATKPVTGQTFIFTAPVPVAPTGLLFSSNTTSSETLNWTDASSNEVGFAIYRSTDNTTFTFVTQTAANATSSIQTGLTPNTTYYWKVYAVTEGALSTALSGNKATDCTSAPTLIATETCVGGSTGTITATPTDGVATHQYSINAGAFQPSPVFNGLAAGSYIITSRIPGKCSVEAPSILVTNYATSADDQTTAGADTWIGHVYDSTNFANYIGHYTEALNFNELFGGGATCFSVMSTSSTATTRSIYTTTFSVKYRMASTLAGMYVANLGSDDGSRLTVDGVMVYNNWADQAFSTKPSVLFNLTGSSNLLYEFYQNAGGNQLMFNNLTLLFTNQLTANTTQNYCVAASGATISGNAYGTLPAGITTSGTGYQWTYSTTPGGARINISGATSATLTPSSSIVPFNTPGTYYVFRKALLSSANNISPNPYVATNESNMATITVGGVLFAAVPTTNLITYYKLNGNAIDETGANNGTLQNSPTGAVDRLGTTGGAYTFDGINQYISGSKQYVNPTNFSVSIWFKTTTVKGGKLIGFGATQVGQSVQYDRHLYMNNAGQLYFGLYNGGAQTLNSTAAYNDNAWHVATVTVSTTNGTYMYVDGNQVAYSATMTTPQITTGYWKVAYDNLTGWPSIPTSFYFAGTLDDVLIYDRALTAAEVASIYAPTSAITNNSPVCVASTLSFTAPAFANTTYSWSGPNSFASSLQNPTLTYAVAYAGTYTLQATTGSCITSTTTLVTSTTIPGIWTGNISTDWAEPRNWCTGVVPVASTNVVIGASLPRMPVVTSNAVSNKLNIISGDSLTVTAATLHVADTITNAGTLDSRNGTIDFNGTVGQQVAGTTFTGHSLLNLTSSNASTGGLTITSGASAGPLNITGTLAFGNVNNATIKTGDNIVLISTATGTAQVADITNNSINSGNAFSGKVTVERYYPPRRAWRLITSPLSGAGSVYSNWQNGGVYVAGRGTYVSGPGAATINGMDISPLSNPSLKVGSTFTSVLNTLTTNLSNGTAASADNKGFFLFVRGDRTNNNFLIPNANITTLSSIGKLQTGAQVFSLSILMNAYTLIGNPYASPIDFNKLTKNNMVSRFYVWDPYLNTQQGGYVMMDDIGHAGTFTPSPSNPPGGQNNFIQSSQAFFVQTLANGPASLSFAETAKSTVNNLSMFRPMNVKASIGSLNTGLYLLNADSSVWLADGNLAQFDKSFNNIVDYQDALKFNNVYETFGLLEGTISLAADRRQPLVLNDTLFFKLTKTRPLKYQFKFAPDNLSANLIPVLQDKYTTIPVTLSPTDTSIVNFEVNASPASQDAYRFYITFKEAPLKYKSIKAYPKNNFITVEWLVENEAGIQSYVIEKSIDGTNFTPAGSMLPTTSSSSTNSYLWQDVNAVAGINYYRIKNSNKDGSFTYSTIVQVTISNASTSITIYPNPVVDKTIVMQLKYMPKGRYVTRVINKLGQVIASNNYDHAGGTASQQIPVSSLLANGIYTIEITNPDKSTKLVNVLMQ